MWKSGLFRRFWMAQLLAVGVALLIVALVLGMLLVNRVYRDHLALLRQRAEQVTQLAEQWSDGSISQLNFLASLRLLDRAAAARIQVFSPWGELIFDSRRGSRIDPPISEAMINGALSGRPGSGLGPVQSSLREGDYRLTWVIEPFPLNGRFGAVLLSSTVSDLGGAVKKLFGLITLATVAGLLVSLPIIILVAKRTVRHLMTMHQAALALAEGDFQQRVPVQGRDEVAQLGKAFNRMADHLQSLEELRREWIGNISHELRTPLTSLRGFLQAMKDDIVPPAERHQYLPLALGEVARLTRLTDDLLELARIEGDGLRLAPHRLQAGEALARAVESLLPVAAQRSVRMELKRDRRDPDDIRADHAIQADPDRLQQVLVNILSNAIRFSPEGGVVRASVSREGVMVRITVEDEGPGIPPEQLPRIFDRFYKADRSRSQKESADSFALGSGLGLTIARHLVEAMRGGIMAESRVGDGTRIIIDLPYAG